MDQARVRMMTFLSASREKEIKLSMLESTTSQRFCGTVVARRDHI